MLVFERPENRVRSLSFIGKSDRGAIIFYDWKFIYAKGSESRV